MNRTLGTTLSSPAADQQALLDKYPAEEDSSAVLMTLQRLGF